MEIYVKIFGGDHFSDRNDVRLRQVVVRSSRFMVENSRPIIVVGILRVGCSLAKIRRSSLSGVGVRCPVAHGRVAS